MSPLAVGLILLSAFLHAAWNFHGKSRNPSGAFFLVGIALGVAVCSPLLLPFAGAIPSIPAAVWALLALTGLCMAVYYLGLASAYRAGDMSLAYPIARAAPAVLVVGAMLALGCGEEISRLCSLGAVLVVGGAVLLPMRRFADLRLANYRNACCLLALVAAAGTTGYSIADAAALERLREPSGPFTPVTAPLVYIVLEGAAASVWMAVLVLPRAGERRQLRSVLREQKLSAGAMGVMIYLTYALVLASLAFVDNVSYAVAFRQLSIPLGALLGIALLKEPSPPPKTLGLAVLMAGLVLVALG